MRWSVRWPADNRPRKARIPAPLVLIPALIAGGLVSVQSAASADQQASRAVVSECNVSIPMSDGVALKANIVRPAGPGAYPTLLTVTPYGKDASATSSVTPAGGAECNAGTPDTATLAPSGYSVITVDTRGRGASGGIFDLYGPRTRQDYAELLDWLQAQPWSDGKVGATGCSAVGFGALSVTVADAERVRAGKPRAVFATWADAPFPDMYRDLVSAPFIAASSQSDLAALYSPLLHANDPDSAPALIDHLQPSALTEVYADYQTDGDRAFDSPWYEYRSPVTYAGRLRVPIAVTATSSDVAHFLRGTTTFFRKLKASAKPVLIVHPGGHCSAFASDPSLGFGSRAETVKKWFDRWLKNDANGIDRLAPVNLLIEGAGWRRGAAWPLRETCFTRFYLDPAASGTATSRNDGSLRPAPPAQPGRDVLPYQPLWADSAQAYAGLAGIPYGTLAPANRLFEATSLTYTSAPFEADTTIAGPVTSDIWATFDRPDGMLVGLLFDVAPDGTATWLANGWLRASQRAVDHSRTLYGPGGVVIQPYHPFTRESQRPVDPAVSERYLIEMLPTIARLRAGHRLRLSIVSADAPTNHFPSVARALATAGATAFIDRGREHPSHLVVPTVAEPGRSVPGAGPCKQ